MGDDDEQLGWPGTPLPVLDPRVPHPAVGCAKAVGLLVVICVVVAGTAVWLVARSLGPATRGLDRLGEGLAEGGIEGPGPGDGTDSEGRGVVVVPADGLVDRASVQVASDGFGDADVVGVTTCLREVQDEGRGIADACDLNEFATFAVPADGPVRVPYELRRVATVGAAAVDCGTSPGRCVLVLTDMDDYRRSGFAPVAFAADEPAPALVPSGGPRPAGGLPASATPTGAVADGTVLRITALGFVPGEPLQVSVCDGRFATAPPTSACAALHDINWFIGTRFTPETEAVALDDLALRADERGVATVRHAVAASFRPFGSGLGDQVDLEGALVDCRAPSARCSIVVAAAADPTRAAVVPYVLAGR